MGKIRQNQMTK